MAYYNFHPVSGFSAKGTVKEFLLQTGDLYKPENMWNYQR